MDFYWTSSPLASYVDGSSGFYVGGGGYLNYNYVRNSYGVRGVVSLSSDAKLLGSGTYDDMCMLVVDNQRKKAYNLDMF